MNAFANWLFTLLLGWTGGLANRAWNAVVNAAGGISGFFARYWLLLVVGLIVFGTLMDYAVWLARWRPYLVWRSWLRRTLHRRDIQRAKESLNQQEMDEQTLHTIADWVQTPQEQYPVYELENEQPLPEEFQPVPDQQAWSYGEANPFVVESQPGMPYEQQPFKPVNRLFHHEEEQPQEAMDYETWQAQQEAEAQRQGLPTRRRRSERGKGRTLVNRLQDLRERLSPDDQEEGMLDGLPAPVRQQDAFHEAVYPHSYQRPQPPIAPWPSDQEQPHQQGEQP